MLTAAHCLEDLRDVFVGDDPTGEGGATIVRVVLHPSYEPGVRTLSHGDAGQRLALMQSTAAVAAWLRAQLPSLAPQS